MGIPTAGFVDVKVLSEVVVQYAAELLFSLSRSTASSNILMRANSSRILVEESWQNPGFVSIRRILFGKAATLC